MEQVRYLPFGGWRTEPANLPGSRGYTGHMMNNLGDGGSCFRSIVNGQRSIVNEVARGVIINLQSVIGNGRSRHRLIMVGTAVWRRVWFGVASKVWLGEDSGHSGKPKTAPQ